MKQLERSSCCWADWWGLRPVHLCIIPSRWAPAISRVINPLVGVITPSYLFIRPFLGVTARFTTIAGPSCYCFKPVISVKRGYLSGEGPLWKCVHFVSRGPMLSRQVFHDTFHGYCRSRKVSSNYNLSPWTGYLTTSPKNIGSIPKMMGLGNGDSFKIWA